MVLKARRAAVAALLLWCVLAAAPAAQAQVAGPVRGVSFYYLDGLAEDFGFVLDRVWTDDPVVGAKLDNLFAAWRTAGVNWVRLLVISDRFPGEPYPDPGTLPGNRIAKVNKFMTAPRAAGFTFEIVLIDNKRDVGLGAGELPNYSPHKTWTAAWIDRMNYSRLGLVLLGGDLQPCDAPGAQVICAGEPGASPTARRHGAYIKMMWPWARKRWPNLNLNYEVIGGGTPTNNFEQLRRIAAWVNANTPDVPSVTASLYIYPPLPAGTTWPQFADAYTQMLNAYHAVSSKPLWIDEFGYSIESNTVSPGCPPGVITECDQEAYFTGFLAAAVCRRGARPPYPILTWLGSNDFPYVFGSWWGLMRGFDGVNQPVPRQAWGVLSFYYNLGACPP